MEDLKGLFTSLHQTFDVVEKVLDHDALEFLPALKIYNPSHRSSYMTNVRRVKAYNEEVMEYLESMEKRIAKLRHHFRLRHARAVFYSAPMSSLPSDVIPIVFRMAVPDRIYLGCVQDAMRLSQVCAAWRGVAFSMKDLWRNISVPLSRVMGIEEYLIRSGSRPLHLDIYERDINLNDQMLLGSMFEHLGVWGRIQLLKLPYDIMLRCLAETGGVPWSRWRVGLSEVLSSSFSFARRLQHHKPYRSIWDD